MFFRKLKDSSTPPDRHFGGESMFVAIVTCALISFIGVSLTKLHNMSFRSLVSSESTMQAQHYAKTKMDYLVYSGYNSLANQDKTTITGTDYKDAVVLSSVTTDTNGVNKRTVTVNIYKGNENSPRSSLSQVFYANDSQRFVVNGNDKTNSISMHYDSENDKLYAKVDGVEKQLGGENRVLNKNAPDKELSMRHSDGKYYVKIDGQVEERFLTNYTPVYKGDLNNLLDTGTYNGAELGNSPDGDTRWHYIENIRHTNMANYYVDQKVTNFYTGDIYHRQCRDGTWSDWVKLNSENLIDFSSGINITSAIVSSINGSGYYEVPFDGYVKAFVTSGGYIVLMTSPGHTCTDYPYIFLHMHPGDAYDQTSYVPVKKGLRLYRGSDYFYSGGWGIILYPMTR